MVNNSNPTTTSSRSNKSLYKSKHTYQTLGPSAPASSTYYKQADWSDKNIGFSGVQVTGTAFDEAAFRHGYDSHNASGRDASATLEAVKRGEAMPSRPKVMDKSFAAASGGEGEDGAGRPAKKREKRKHDYSKDAAAMLTSEEDDRGIWGPASKAEKDLQEDSVTDLARGELKEYQIQERADLAKKAAAKKSREVRINERGAALLVHLTDFFPYKPMNQRHRRRRAPTTRPTSTAWWRGRWPTCSRPAWPPTPSPGPPPRLSTGPQSTTTRGGRGRTLLRA